MCNLINTHTHTPSIIDPPWEDQCEWHRMTRMTRPDCAVMCNLINTHTHTPSIIDPPWEDQCEWHRMTRMTRPDCAVMCNLINTHTHTHTHTNGKKTHTHTHTPLGVSRNPAAEDNRCSCSSSLPGACSHPGGREGSVCSPLPFLWGTNLRLGCMALVGLYELLVGLFGLGSVASTEPRVLGTATVQQAWWSERAEP